jgi:hypothetical protein
MQRVVCHMSASHSDDTDDIGQAGAGHTHAGIASKTLPTPGRATEAHSVGASYSNFSRFKETETKSCFPFTLDLPSIVLQSVIFTREFSGFSN